MNSGIVVVFRKRPTGSTMALNIFGQPGFGWRWVAVVSLFAVGLLGFSAGVTLTERPDVQTEGWLVRAYYVLGLFVVGGLDVGTPTGGPLWARGMLWIAYFGAPLLTASAVIEAAVRLLNPQGWRFRNLENHLVIYGSGQLTESYLRMLRRHAPNAKVVVVDDPFDPSRQRELEEKYGVITLTGNLTMGFLLKRLNLSQARRVLILGGDDFRALEAATRVLEVAPQLKFKVIIHCDNLRFMRSLYNTALYRHCVIFNTYNLAALSFVRNRLSDHFKRSPDRDVVVLAGFGRFGQSVLEQLNKITEEIEHVILIDQDANRRILVVEEQQRLSQGYRRSVLHGDISNPTVWRSMVETVDLTEGQPTVILGTGVERDNLRTSLWIKSKFPNAFVFVRTNEVSQFAAQVAQERDLTSFIIDQLVEEAIPARWTR